MITIPVPDYPASTELVSIEGVTYQLTFQFNTRATCWTLSIATAAGVEILSGIKLVLDYELIADYVDRDIPPGLLYAIDPSQETQRIGRDDLKSTGKVKLVYMTEAERAAI